MFTAEYTDINRPDDADLPSVNANGVPHLTLASSYDETNNVCTYIMGAGIDENCRVVSIGIAFCYGKPLAFNPENTVAVHIRRIREKIEINPKNPKYLKVVWGIGYKVEKF